MSLLLLLSGYIPTVPSGDPPYPIQPQPETPEEPLADGIWLREEKVPSSD